MKLITLSLALVLVVFAFGCSKRDAATNLGVIELTPNTPKHVKIGDVDWTFTETVAGEHEPTIKAKTTDWKVTADDIKNGLVSSAIKPGATMKMEIDLSTVPTNLETVGMFGRNEARFTLKY